MDDFHTIYIDINMPSYQDEAMNINLMQQTSRIIIIP